jgi:tetratricopeptide (TPR) repeat protein
MALIRCRRDNWEKVSCISGIARRAIFQTVALAFLPIGWVSAAPVKVENPLQSPAWQLFYNNEYERAADLFRAELEKNPDDPIAYNHAAQAILYRELFRNGALESQLVTGNNPFLRRPKMNVDPAVRAEFDQDIGKAIAISNRRLERDSHDAEALYALSVTYGLRANFRFLVEKAWTEALHDATSSRKYSDKLLQLEPNLTDAYLIQGVHDYVVGSLPFYQKMVGFLAGFHGDRERGLRELQDVAEHGVLNKYDAQILLAIVYRRERRPKDAIPFLNQVCQVFPHNYLFRLEQVQMYSDAGDKASALRVLNEVEQMRLAGTEGFRDLPAVKVKYVRGNLLFWYGDFNLALKDMLDATAKAQDLDLNTAVLAWLRLGQLYDLQGNHAEAVKAYRETMRTAPASTAANEAKGYISSPYKRKPVNS